MQVSQKSFYALLENCLLRENCVFTGMCVELNGAISNVFNNVNFRNSVRQEKTSSTLRCQPMIWHWKSRKILRDEVLQRPVPEEIKRKF